MFFPTHLDLSERNRTPSPWEAYLRWTGEEPAPCLAVAEDTLADYYEDKMDFDVGVGD